MKPHVLILTFCRNPALLYGSTLTFKTLRTGFPTAHVTVYENGSIPSARQQIHSAARESGCEVIQFTRSIAHDAWLRHVLTEYPLHGPVVIVDPDVVFWESVEGWDFGSALMAGRLMPEFWDREFSGCLTLPRIHPSFLWIPDVGQLREAILELEEPFRAWGTLKASGMRLIEQAIVTIAGTRVFFDTLANLYAEIEPRARPLQAHELDAYDHIFLGSHIDLCVGPDKSPAFAVLRDSHRAASSGDLSSLRGVWRMQDEYFRDRKPDNNHWVPGRS